MYVCSCFGITEDQVRAHAAAGACTPRQIAATSGAGTDCGSCVRRIQGLLGRPCPRREPAAAAPATESAAVPTTARPLPAAPAPALSPLPTAV
ncbi:(2Fe-2S)-binding protein [Streptomyces xiamenensis]|uniref:(2Fe-2S)-binding protein n=1 Tax=Streptomyces xiamenensis TaxID=408015 RepID=UPI00069F0008|nr:(2Fe-2S)-binding protein [Streptomyces xiamenensis]